MKEALFKKRKTINRFEEFCEYIKDKDRSSLKRNRQLSRR
jgi:hypothetical protein